MNTAAKKKQPARRFAAAASRRWMMTVAMCAVGLGMLAGPAQAGTFDSWGKKVKITFSGYTPSGGGTLTNFPALVVLSEAITNFTYGSFKSGVYDDLRFTAADETTVLNYEIESWDAAGKSYVWVQLPTLASSSDYIWAYWGKSGESAPAYSVNGATWSSDFVGVWHMATTNGALSAKESTSSNLASKVAGATNSTGRVGGGGYFSGTNKIYTAPINFPYGNTARTVSYWFKDRTLPVYGAGHYHCVYGAEWSGGVLYSSFGRFGFEIVNLLVHNGSQDCETGGSIVKQGIWMYATYVSKTNTATVIYADGVLKTGEKNMSVAQKTFFTIGGTAGDEDIDEMRVENVVRSAGWVWAVHKNMATNGVFAGSFNAYGSVATAPGAPVIANAAGGATNVQATTACLNGTLTTNGGYDTAVWVYYGTNNGGITASAWQTGALVATNLAADPNPKDYSYPAAGLTADTHYFYRFYASNSVDTAWATGVKEFDTKISAAPTILSAAAPNVEDFDILLLTWGGTFVTETGFVINYTNAVTNVTAMAGANVTNLTISPLPANTTYGFRMAATNAAGLGPWSGWTQATTPAVTEKFANWGRRMKITFPGYAPAGGGTLTNFPALVVLSEEIPGFAYGDFKSGANADLRFAKYTMGLELNYEIESWDAAGKSYVWVQVPLLASSNDYIWAYWSKGGQSVPAYSVNGAAWSSDFVGVWHMATTNGALSAKESASSNLASVVAGATSSTGRVGGGGYFFGTNTIYTPVINFPYGRTARTVSYWFRDRTLPGDHPHCVWGNLNTRSIDRGGTAKNICMHNGDYYAETSGNIVKSNVWMYAAYVSPSNTATAIYADGVSKALSHADIIPVVQATIFRIGGTWGNTAVNGDEDIDEFRVENVARSAGWLWAVHKNMVTNGVFAGSFNGYGAITEVKPGGTLMLIQ